MMKLYQASKKGFVLVFLFASFLATAQSNTVTGRVTSGDDGTTLPGVSILEKGTTNGTVTDADGNFRLNVGKNATLTFSFVGYLTQEVVLGDQSTVNVSLQTDITTLSEILVVGYGEVQKKDATGAVLNMSSKDFNKGVLSSPQDLMLGKFAGVAITSNSGAPGARSTIRIRGGSSMSASNDPLIIIDGFPVDNVPATGDGSIAGVPNVLASLNPNDIETFTVLKDASATAIYGSRASNGVIIITTKKGKEGKPKLSYNGTVSVSTPTKTMEVFNGDEYRALITELAESGVSGLNDAAVARLGTSSTDWQEEIYREAVSQDHNLSLEGAYKKLPYRVSYGYTDQQGIIRTTGFKRNSLSINLNPSLLDDNLKLNISAKGSVFDNNFGPDGVIGNAISMDPTRPVYDNSTAYGGYYTPLRVDGSNLVNQSATGNPVAMIEQTDNTSQAKRFVGNFQAEYKLPFLPELKVVVNAGMDQTTSEGHNYAPQTAGFTANTTGIPQGRKNDYSAKNKSQLLDLYFNYNKLIGDHKIDFTAGYGWQYFYREGYTFNRNFDESIVNTPARTTKNENYLVSFYGRLNYTLITSI